MTIHASETLLVRFDEATPTVDFRDAGNPSDVLVIHAHGVQDPPTQQANGVTRHMACLVPFDRAMNNFQLGNDANFALKLVNAFRDNRTDFSVSLGAASSLKIYPYFTVMNEVEQVLNHLYQSKACDSVCLRRLQDGHDTIPLSVLLEALHPVAASSIVNYYQSFLNMTCRSSTVKSQPGLGGAEQAYPNGLYALDSSDTLPRIAVSA